MLVLWGNVFPRLTCIRVPMRTEPRIWTGYAYDEFSNSTMDGFIGRSASCLMQAMGTGLDEAAYSLGALPPVLER